MRPKRYAILCIDKDVGLPIFGEMRGINKDPMETSGYIQGFVQRYLDLVRKTGKRDFSERDLPGYLQDILREYIKSGGEVPKEIEENHIASLFAGLINFSKEVGLQPFVMYLFGRWGRDGKIKIGNVTLYFIEDRNAPLNQYIAIIDEGDLMPPLEEDREFVIDCIKPLYTRDIGIEGVIILDEKSAKEIEGKKKLSDIVYKVISTR